MYKYKMPGKTSFQDRWVSDGLVKRPWLSPVKDYDQLHHGYSIFFKMVILFLIFKEMSEP